MDTNWHEEGKHGFRGLTLIVGYRAGLVVATNSASKARSFDRGSPYPPGRSRNAPFVRPAERMRIPGFVRGAFAPEVKLTDPRRKSGGQAGDQGIRAARRRTGDG